MKSKWTVVVPRSRLVSVVAWDNVFSSVQGGNLCPCRAIGLLDEHVGVSGSRCHVCDDWERYEAVAVVSRHRHLGLDARAFGRPLATTLAVSSSVISIVTRVQL